MFALQLFAMKLKLQFDYLPCFSLVKFSMINFVCFCGMFTTMTVAFTFSYEAYNFHTIMQMW